MRYFLFLSFAVLVITGQAQESKNAISKSQEKWIKVYQKQKNIPKTEAMLTHADPEPELGEGFSNLFNGKDLAGWSPLGGHCTYEVEGDVVVGTCVAKSPSTYLTTDKKDYQDFVFTAELKHVVDGNTGIMFRSIEKAGKKEGTSSLIGPQCEVEAYSKQRFWTGGIYGQGAGGWIYPMWLDAHEGARTAMKKQGEWNRITIQAKGKVIKTWLNGKPAAHWETDTYEKGRFGLQIHSGKEGVIHFRNVKVKEI